MNVDALVMVVNMKKLPGMKSTHRAVLLALASEADAKFECVMLLREIAEEAWIQQITARQALDVLIRRGLVEDLGLCGEYAHRYRLAICCGTQGRVSV